MILDKFTGFHYFSLLCIDIYFCYQCPVCEKTNETKRTFSRENSRVGMHACALSLLLYSYSSTASSLTPVLQ